MSPVALTSCEPMKRSSRSTTVRPPLVMLAVRFATSVPRFEVFLAVTFRRPAA